MTMPSVRRHSLMASLSLGLACLGLLLPGLGCGDDDSPTPPKPPSGPDRSSPQAVLASLREAYVDRQIDDYDSLLAADFEFYFAEEDHAIAEKYTRSEEILVHRSMFSAADVQYIRLSFTLGEPALDEGRPDTLGVDAHLWTILMAVEELELRRTEGGEIKTYGLDDGSDRFWLRRENPAAPATGDTIWTIVRWEELSRHGLRQDGQWGGTLSRESTWGAIKSLYR